MITVIFKKMIEQGYLQNFIRFIINTLFTGWYLKVHLQQNFLSYNLILKICLLQTNRCLTIKLIKRDILMLFVKTGLPHIYIYAGTCTKVIVPTLNTLYYYAHWYCKSENRLSKFRSFDLMKKYPF